MKSRHITPKRKRAIAWYSKFGTAKHAPCCRCGLPLTFKQSTLDHIIPKAFGGEDSLENWGLSHKQCNHKHGTLVYNIINPVVHSPS